MQNKPLHIGIIAGEASGDTLGAGLIHDFKKQYPNAIFEGVGGPKMIEQGCRSLYPMHELSLMGITEVISHLPRILKIRRNIKTFFLKKKPDLFIGIDLPDFNLNVEAALKNSSIKTAHYVSPTVWAWREGRMKKIKRAVDLMLGIFPFEKKIYQKYQVPYQFVGNPLADEIPENIDIKEARLKIGLDLDKKVLALLPGSRHVEIKKLAKDFLEAAKICQQKYPTLQLVTSMVNDNRQKEFELILEQSASDLPIKILQGDSHLAMAAADVVLVASGTATLEALLFEKPMVVAYRINWPSYLIGKCMVKITLVAMANLLAEREIVPEFLQNHCTPKNLSQAVIEYFENQGKVKTLIQEYKEIRQTIQKNANERATNALVSLLEPV